MKTYTVIQVSENTNSFGYRSLLCLAPDGEGIELLRQAYSPDPVPEQGDEVEVPEEGEYLSRELPSVSPKQAKELIAQVTALKS